MKTPSSYTFRTAIPPWTSMSSRTFRPLASRRSISLFSVPYSSPWTSAHSTKSPASIRLRNSSRVRNTYSRPSVSCGRRARVVAETEYSRFRSAARSCSTKELFPTPDGPEITTTNGRGPAPIRASGSLDVLDLLPDPLKFLFHFHHLFHDRHVGRFGSDRVYLPIHFL